MYIKNRECENCNYGIKENISKKEGRRDVGMKYHIMAFFLGFVLDLLLGDPYFLPHPIRLIGKLITMLEKRLLKKEKKQNRKKGR